MSAAVNGRPQALAWNIGTTASTMSAGPMARLSGHGGRQRVQHQGAVRVDYALRAAGGARGVAHRRRGVLVEIGQVGGGRRRRLTAVRSRACPRAARRPRRSRRRAGRRPARGTSPTTAAATRPPARLGPPRGARCTPARPDGAGGSACGARRRAAARQSSASRWRSWFQQRVATRSPGATPSRRSAAGEPAGAVQGLSPGSAVNGPVGAAAHNRPRAEERLGAARDGGNGELVIHRQAEHGRLLLSQCEDASGEDAAGRSQTRVGIVYNPGCCTKNSQITAVASRSRLTRPTDPPTGGPPGQVCPPPSIV